jgi:hypothetical protein
MATKSPDVRSVAEQGFLQAGIPAVLVGELLDAYSELKRRFHSGDYRPNAVEGGRFSEAAFRVLEWATIGTFTALGDPAFKTDPLIKRLEQTTRTAFPESVRIHIPRTLRLIYDIRNKRDAAHLADGIDPNVQDAHLVVANASWVLAELVRLYHSVSAAEAQRMIETLVKRDVPMIQVIDGFPRILTTLKASEHCMVLLYWHGERMTFEDLRAWLPESMRRNMVRTLQGLDTKHWVHIADDAVTVTDVGRREVEERGWVSPA